MAEAGYVNLRNEMHRKGIKSKAMANLISNAEKTVHNKLTGVTDFTVQEALLIRENLFPEFTMKDLFKRE